MREQNRPPRSSPQDDDRIPLTARPWFDPSAISAVKIKPPDPPPDDEPPRRFERSIARFTRQKATVED